MRARVKSSAVEIKDYYHKKSKDKKKDSCQSLFAHALYKIHGPRRTAGVVGATQKKTKTQRETALSPLLSEGRKKKEEGVV